MYVCICYDKSPIQKSLVRIWAYTTVLIIVTCVDYISSYACHRNDCSLFKSLVMPLTAIPLRHGNTGAGVNKIYKRGANRQLSAG